MNDRFRPDAAARRVIPMAGKRGDRIVIDDPHGTATPEEVAAARESFRATCKMVAASGVEPVIVMSRLHQP